ncbi:oxidoreductase [Klebsiella michiganensis]|nr:oxidoreductase [Klebsiella michiganensis]
MHYIPLGDTDLRVSRLCLGCMTFGEPDRVTTHGPYRKRAAAR